MEKARGKDFRGKHKRDGSEMGPVKHVSDQETYDKIK